MHGPRAVSAESMSCGQSRRLDMNIHLSYVQVDAVRDDLTADKTGNPRMKDQSIHAWICPVRLDSTPQPWTAYPREVVRGLYLLGLRILR